MSTATTEVFRIYIKAPIDKVWAANFTPETIAEGARTLTWDLREDDHGVTSVTVTHDLAAAPKTRLFVTGTGDPSEGGGGGWAWILSDLKSLMETGSSMFVRP